MPTLPTGLPIFVFFFILPVLPVSSAIVFVSRRRHLFCFVDFEQIFGFVFSKTKTVLFPEFSHCFCFASFENLNSKFTIFVPRMTFCRLAGWFELSKFSFFFLENN